MIIIYNVCTGTNNFSDGTIYHLCECAMILTDCPVQKTFSSCCVSSLVTVINRTRVLQ